MQDVQYSARIPNVEEYLELESLLHELDATSPTQAERALAGSLFGVVATIGGQTIGFGRVIGDGAIFWMITDVYVAPAHQRRGIGSQVVARLLDQIKARGIPGTSGSIILFSAKGKEQFYEKFGFGARPNGWEGAGMELEIDF
jgi:GNAT superfamily N-acetyltransferase